MVKFLSLIGVLIFFRIVPVLGAEKGMPQLNSEFWLAQVFWLTFIFSILYLVIWKFIIPKITDSIENRRKHVINDLDEAQKLKESAEKKLTEYKKIIEDSKNQAKKIILDNRKKLERSITEKKKKFEKEIEDELTNVERQIKKFQKSSADNINKIAIEVSNEVIKKTLGIQTNESNVTAIVNDISKTKLKKYL